MEPEPVDARMARAPIRLDPERDLVHSKVGNLDDAVNGETLYIFRAEDIVPHLADAIEARAQGSITRVLTLGDAFIGYAQGAHHHQRNTLIGHRNS